MNDIHVPGSKSMTQRALVIAALAGGRVEIGGAVECDDSRYLTRNLRAMGARVEWSGDNVTVTAKKLITPKNPLYCGNAGTAMRLGCCFSILIDGPLVMDGDGRMRQRPVGKLADALDALGVEAEYLGEVNCPPVRLNRRRIPPQEVEVDCSDSSQFVSGLLLVAPKLESGLRLVLAGDVVSLPYIDMTVSMMRRAGATVERDGNTIRVARGGYRLAVAGATIEVEPDWSSASFLLAAGFITGRRISVAGLKPLESSVQGDAIFPELLNRLRTVGNHDFNLSGTPDLIAPLAAAALFAQNKTKIIGVAHARIKESDRIATLASAFRKLGANVTELPDGLCIEPLPELPRQVVNLDPANDHRMAMAFGVIALRTQNITVMNPQCVSKSFPQFWGVLQKIRGKV